MSYFFDECISHRIVDMLKLFGEDVIHISKVTTCNLGDPDEKWIPEFAKLNRILVTDDTRMRKRPHQRAMLQTHEVRAVFIAGGFANLQFWPQVVFVVNRWEEIKRHTLKCKSGDHFRVPMRGAIEGMKRA